MRRPSDVPAAFSLFVAPADVRGLFYCPERYLQLPDGLQQVYDENKAAWRGARGPLR